MTPESQVRDRGPNRPPSMADVARLAGVSTQTVSRALRGHQYVRPTTRAKVIDAVTATGYRMNSAARALSSGRTHTIGVVTMATSSYAGAVTQLRIEQAAQLHGYQILGTQAATLEPATVAAAVARLEGRGVEGLILALPVDPWQSASETPAPTLPAVTIGGPTGGRHPALAVDQEQVARLATDHLLDLGHRTVHLVAGPQDWADSARRSDGWQNSLIRAGRSVPTPIRGDWTPESGYQAGLVLGKDPSVTAIFAASDDMAFGAIRALHELGRQVPHDASVVGVDDIALAAYCNPALTTVAQPFTALTAAAVDHVVALIEEADPPAAPDLTTELVLRASTAPPPHDD